MQTDFQISYTLDILLYIDCMINKQKHERHDEDVQKFVPRLGTISDKYLEKLIKINKRVPEMIEYIVSILINNDHLHEWSMTDLFDSHKSLVTTFKKSSQYSNASKGLKKFIKDDYFKVMPLIKVIITDLERLDFKKFWLEEKLPLLKERISEYQLILDEFDIAAYVNNWTTDKKILTSGPWYVLTYPGYDYKTLLQAYRITSSVVTPEKLFDCIISYGVNTNSYTKICKRLKKGIDLKHEYKSHDQYKTFKSFSAYIEICLKIGLRVYLIEKCDPTSPDIPIPRQHYFAAEVHAHIIRNPKQDDVSTKDYLEALMKEYSI